MTKRTANVNVKMMPAIQNVFDLWTVMFKIVKFREDMVSDDFYHFLFQDGKLVGSILLGNTTLGPGIKKAIEGRVDFGHVLAERGNTTELIEFIKDLG